MQINERIKREREKAGLKPGQLAKTLGIPRTTYLYWESATPDVEKIKSVARALGKDENYFFEQIDEKTDESDETKISMVNEEAAPYEVKAETIKGHVLYVQAKDLAASFERLIEEKERIIELVKFQAAKAEKDKDRLFKALDDAQKTINEVLKPIKEQTQEILISSKETADHFVEFANEVRVEHRVMMDSIDKASEQPIGTTRAKAGNVELFVKQEHSGKGKAEPGKKN